MLKVSLLLSVVTVASAVPLYDKITPRSGEACGYESCPETSSDVLNVHLVPHTHDDVGWLKTVDQYYYGSNNTIQKAGVQYILDSVVRELWEDPKRRFIYVETAFFWKWWVRQTDAIKDKVHTLVRQGRLQFVGGAWSMNDEAAAHYQSTIDQFTLGLEKLNKTFGECGRPRVGWQIDPFGHSREFASLLAAMGYDGLFLGRIDYQDKESRLQNKNMEMVWRGNDDIGKDSDIFTGILYNTYSPPRGFCFDILCSDDPIVDDPDSPLFNVDERVDRFMEVCRKMSQAYRSNNILVTMGDDFHYQDAGMWFKNLDLLISKLNHILSRQVTTFMEYVTKQASSYRTNNVILTMGGDFTYQDASMWYKNLDKLIEYSNLKAAKDGMNMKFMYSTPTCYLKAVKDANPVLPIKQDDFFPYASDPNAYWTGYFSSRPTTKYFEREANNYLQAVKQLQVLANLDKHNVFVLNELRNAIGIMQHHDAITGTEKQHVARDYERILTQSVDDALIISKQAFNKIKQGKSSKPPMFSYDRCHFNESSCETSESSNNFIVTVYNSLGWNVVKYIDVPVVEADYEVYDYKGEKLKSYLTEIPENILKYIPTRKSKATHSLYFMAELSPLSMTAYYVKKLVKNNKVKRSTARNYEIYKILNHYSDDSEEVDESPKVDVKKLEDLSRELDSLIDKLKHGPPDYDYDNNNDSRVKRDATIEDYYDSSNSYSEILKDPRIIDVRNLVNDYVKGKPIIEEVQYDAIRTVQNNINDALEDVDKERKVLMGELKRIASDLENTRKKGKFNYVDIFSKMNEGEMQMLSDEPKVDGEVTMSYGFYPGCVGNNEEAANRSSGAYIFRPNATNPEPYKHELKIQNVVDNEDFRRTITNIGNELSIVETIFKKLSITQVDWFVRIFIDDGVGKDVVLTYKTGILNNGEFYTDSNGRQMLKRILNKRPQWNVTLHEPVAGNYYPVVNEMYIENDNERFTVLTDRSEGGSSLVEGEIQLMLHRRLLHDDAFGVDEALNETVQGLPLAAVGTHIIVRSKDEVAIEKAKLELSNRPIVFISDAKDMTLKDWAKMDNYHSYASIPLPNGLHLLTLEPWGEDLLLRIENYMTESSSSTIAVDLKSIFKNIKIMALKETMLAANQWAGAKKWHWKTENDFVGRFNNDYGIAGDSAKVGNTAPDVKDNGFIVNLKAKQIRTFIISYKMI